MVLVCTWIYLLKLVFVVGMMTSCITDMKKLAAKNDPFIPQINQLTHQTKQRYSPTTVRIYETYKNHFCLQVV